MSSEGCRPMLRRLAFLLLLVTFVAAPVSAEIGRIKRVYGQAQVRRGAALLPAAPGQALLERDILETGPDGRISIAFIDNTRFSVGPKSRIAVSQFKFDETTHQ